LKGDEEVEAGSNGSPVATKRRLTREGGEKPKKTGCRAVHGQAAASAGEGKGEV